MQAWITYYEKLIKASFLKWVAYAKSTTSAIKDWDPSSIIKDAALAGQKFETKAVSKLLDQQFKITDARAIKYANQYAASEVRNISKVHKDLIRNAVASSLQGNLSVADQKKLIRGMVGLADNQVKWVENYAKNSGLTGPTLEKAVQKYTDKLIKQRADTIAITESAKATALGQQAVQDDLLARGIISKETHGIKWVATASERTCPICGALDGQIGVIGQGVEGYTVPAHPRCRCRIVLVRLSDVKYPEPKYAVPTKDDAKDYIGMPPGDEKDPLKDRFQAKQDLQKAMRSESLKVKELSKEDKTTLLQYSSHTNQPINKYLNGGMQNLDIKDASLVKTKQDVADLDRILNSMKLDNNIKAYRGVSNYLETYNDALKQALDAPGSILQMNGFVSTSISPEQAAKFAGKNGGRMLEVLLPKGTPGAYLRSVSASASEEEFLVARGLNYIVGDTRIVKYLDSATMKTYDMAVTTIKAVLPDYTVPGPAAIFAENQAFTQSLTKAAATEWRTIFKTKYPDLQVYLNGMDEELQLRTYLSLNKVLKDIPDPTDVLKKVWTQKSNEGFFTGAPNAYGAAAEKEVQLNLAYFSKKSTIESYIQNDVASGFHPVGFSPEWVTTHEIGHNVFNGIKLYDSEMTKDALGIINGARKSGELAKWGKYATYSEDEAFAEMFAGIYHSPPSTLPQFVKDLRKLILG